MCSQWDRCSQYSHLPATGGCVSVVGRIALYSRCKYRLTNRFDTDIRAADATLELCRTPADGVQPVKILFLDLLNN